MSFLQLRSKFKNEGPINFEQSLSISDNITITESITISISSPVTTLSINISDSLAITENISYDIRLQVFPSNQAWGVTLY